MTVQSPIERACQALSAIDEGKQADEPVQGQARGLPKECWIVAAIYLASIGSGVFAAIRLS